MWVVNIQEKRKKTHNIVHGMSSQADLEIMLLSWMFNVKVPLEIGFWEIPARTWNMIDSSGPPTARTHLLVQSLSIVNMLNEKNSENIFLNYYTWNFSSSINKTYIHTVPFLRWKRAFQHIFRLLHLKCRVDFLCSNLSLIYFLRKRQLTSCSNWQMQKSNGEKKNHPERNCSASRRAAFIGKELRHQIFLLEFNILSSSLQTTLFNWIESKFGTLKLPSLLSYKTPYCSLL